MGQFLSKFKDTLRVIEEGLLKPMSAADIEQIDAENYKERIDEILSRSTKNDRIHEILSRSVFNTDGSIDVTGNVNLNYLNITELPLKFNKVSGNFNCANNELTSLIGAPKNVNGKFVCYNNAVKFLDSEVNSMSLVKGKIYV